MKAIQFADFGVPHEVCVCIEASEPGPPGPDEVIVTVDASAINPADLLIVEGRYPGPAALPARLGIEGTGRITAAGKCVSSLATGDRVMILDRTNWAEQVKIGADQAIKLPDQIDVLQAAMIKANPPTALLLLRDFAALQPGEWVVQNAATSAVGRHVIKLARAQGVKTINIVRRSEDVPTLEAIGADLVVVAGEDLGARVHGAIGQAPVRLGLDAVGGRASLHLADCLSDGGIIVNYGFLSGDPCMIRPHHLIVHGITLVGFWLVQRLFRRTRDEIEAVYREIAQLIIDGVIEAPVEATYDLEQVKQALVHAEREGRGGKILFVPNRTAA